MSWIGRAAPEGYVVEGGPGPGRTGMYRVERTVGASGFPETVGYVYVDEAGALIVGLARNDPEGKSVVEAVRSGVLAEWPTL